MQYKVYLQIRDKETNLKSKPLDIEKIILRDDDDFKFNDGSSLTYEDFLFFIKDYECNLIVKERKND